MSGAERLREDATSKDDDDDAEKAASNRKRMRLQWDNAVDKRD